ncbi:hypothetical protein ALC62_11605, partial [Cyphomyrmex costatus]
IAAFRCIDYYNCAMTEVKESCYLRQTPTTCCKNPTEICPASDEDIPTCEVNSNVYLDGEYFKVNDPDLICICQPGYKGLNVPPFCIKPKHSPCFHPAFSHGDFFRRNCAPVFKDYAEKNTCYTMRCQVPGDGVVHRRFPFVMDDNLNKNIIIRYSFVLDMCIFGNLIMHIGDKLQQSPKFPLICLNCTCEVPPVPTCIEIPQNNCTRNITTDIAL